MLLLSWAVKNWNFRRKQEKSQIEGKTYLINVLLLYLTNFKFLNILAYNLLFEELLKVFCMIENLAFLLIPNLKLPVFKKHWIIKNSNKTTRF